MCRVCSCTHKYWRVCITERMKRCKVCVVLAVCVSCIHKALEGVHVFFTHKTPKSVHYVGCACSFHTQNTKKCALHRLCVFPSHTKHQKSVHDIGCACFLHTQNTKRCALHTLCVFSAHTKHQKVYIT